MEKVSGSSSSPASLRWEILRRALLSRSSSEPDHGSQKSTKIISRKAAGGFKLISCHPLSVHLAEGLCTSPGTKDLAGHRDVYICYELPVASVPNLILVQRMEACIDLNDFQISTRYNIDMTGLVCYRKIPYASSGHRSILHKHELLAIRRRPCLFLYKPPRHVQVRAARLLCWYGPHHTTYHTKTFYHSYMCGRDGFKALSFTGSKRVLELGSGYGLAGLSIAASSDACEIVISDGNPQVVDYIQHNISSNAGAFGNTKVKSMTLHWNEEPASDILNSFDIIVASDCTFFKEFHESLARMVKSLLKYSEGSEAIFLSPKRGDSLDRFLEKIMEAGLQYELVEKYDSRVWNLHQNFLKGNDASWPNYLEDHCYPLLVKVSHHEPEQPCHLLL